MNKRYLYLPLILVIVFSCSSGVDDETSVPDPVITVPKVPTQVYPLSNTLCIDNNVEFKWNTSSNG